MKSAISAGRVIRKIIQNEIAPVYFLNGNDGYLQEFFIGELAKVFLKDVGYKTFISLDDDKEQDLLGELSALSLFEEKRIIVVRQIRKMTNKGKSEMLSYFLSPNPSNCVLLINAEDRGKNKFIDSLKQQAVHVDVGSPRGQKFKDWANYIVKRKSIKIASEALDLLIDLQGDSLAKIFNEVEKLSLYAGDDKVIDRATIESTSMHQRQYDIDQLQDALGQRDLGSAFTITTNLLDSGSPVTLITMNLSALFQELLWKKMGARDIKFSWLIRGLVKRNIKQYTDNFSTREVKDILIELRKIDILNKTTSVSPPSLIEPLIIKTCSKIYA